MLINKLSVSVSEILIKLHFGSNLGQSPKMRLENGWKTLIYQGSYKILFLLPPSP